MLRRVYQRNVFHDTLYSCGDDSIDAGTRTHLLVYTLDRNHSIGLADKLNFCPITSDIYIYSNSSLLSRQLYHHA